MYKGRCIDASGADLLEVGQDYYVFESGQYAYISRFPNQGAYFGIYQAARFQLIPAEDPPAEPSKDHIAGLDLSQFYKARLFYAGTYRQSMKLGIYYIQPRTTHAWVYRDQAKERLCGSFPLHWFTDYEIVAAADPEPCQEVTAAPPAEPVDEIVLVERPGGQLSFF